MAMWTSTLDLNLRRILLTRLLGRFWGGAYFSSFSPLSVQQLPRQPLAASNWVRVRNRLAGICGQDLQLVKANVDLRVAPASLPQYKSFYPGHEVVGEVIEIGDDVEHLQVGDRVVLQYGPNCQASGLKTLCRSCAEGCYNLCENTSLPAPVQIGGGWSEEMLIAEQQLFRIPTTLTDEQAVLLEPCAVAIHAVLRHLPLPGERVLVIGAGTIGLLTLQMLRILAPQSEISVLARHPFQVEQATRMGAAHIIYPQDSYIGIQRVTHAQIQRGIPGNQTLVGGYDAIFDTVGKRKTLHHALRWAQTRAAIVLVGVDLHLMRIDLTPIWYQELNLLGSRAHGLENWPIGSQEQHSSFEAALELIEQGYLHPEFLITHHYALNNFQNAILTASTKAQSRAIKVVFDYSLLPASVVPNVRASARRRRPALSIDATEDQLLEEEQDEQDEQDPSQEQQTPVIEPSYTLSQEEEEEEQQATPAHSQYQSASQVTPAHSQYQSASQVTPAHSQYQSLPQPAPVPIQYHQPTPQVAPARTHYQQATPATPVPSSHYQQATPVPSSHYQAAPQPIIEEEEQEQDEQQVVVQNDPHSLPTLREEAFLSHQPFEEAQDWTAPEPSYEDEVPQAAFSDEDDQYANETKSPARTFSAADSARQDAGRSNTNRQRNNKKNTRR